MVQQLAFGTKPDRTPSTPSAFSVTVNDAPGSSSASADASRLGIVGSAKCVVTSEVLELLFEPPRTTLATGGWPIKYLRRFGQKDGAFYFESGRRCATGPALIYLRSADAATANEIFALVDAASSTIAELSRSVSAGSLTAWTVREHAVQPPTVPVRTPSGGKKKTEAAAAIGGTIQYTNGGDDAEGYPEGKHAEEYAVPGAIDRRLSGRKELQLAQYDNEDAAADKGDHLYATIPGGGEREPLYHEFAPPVSIHGDAAENGYGTAEDVMKAETAGRVIPKYGVATAKEASNQISVAAPHSAMLESRGASHHDIATVIESRRNSAASNGYGTVDDVRAAQQSEYLDADNVYDGDHQVRSQTFSTTRTGLAAENGYGTAEDMRATINAPTEYDNAECFIDNDSGPVVGENKREHEPDYVAMQARHSVVMPAELGGPSD